MKTVLVYNPVELTACAMMVQRYNKHFKDASLTFIEQRIEGLLKSFIDPEMQFTGTMGFVIIAIDEEVEGDVRRVHLEFLFNASTFGDSEGLPLYKDGLAYLPLD